MERKEKIKLLNQLAVVVGGISIFISILLLLNYWNTTKTDPLDSEALVALVERLKAEPNNESLKLEIRNLDLLARKAYFTSHWQVRTGGFLLLFSSVLLVFLLKVLYDMNKKIELPDDSDGKGLAVGLLSRRWIGIIGIIVIAGGLLASFTSKDYLEKYELMSDSSEREQLVDEGIEVIEVTSADKPASTDSKEIAGADSTTDEEGLNEGLANQDNTKKTGIEEAADAEKEIISSVSYPDIQEIRKQHNTFRGPLGQGISYHKNIPVEWDGASGKNVLWKVEIPMDGTNSPIIWDKKLLVAGSNDQTRMIYCYDRNSGAKLWEHEASGIEGSPAAPPRTTPDTGLSAPTLATDGERVYAIFGTGDVLAMDMNGNRIWARNLGIPDNHYGHSSSLLCWENKLIVQYDTNSSGRILALNVHDGSSFWDVNREVKISWGSPVLGEVEGKYQVFTSSDPLVIGHDLETGKQLWSVECMMGEVGPSVAFLDGVVYASQEYARLVAIKAGSTSAEIVWENDEYLPEASSPVAIDEILLLATSYGVVACHDAGSGELLWEHECSDGFYGSPMAVDGKIYLMDMGGTCHIYEISKELKVIGEPVLGEKSVVTPAFADGRIYLRGTKYLYCIGD